jgi:hypothetical protein
MRLRFTCLVLIAAAPVFFSCTEERKTSTDGPIVLGDSTTMVMERDSQYLRDVVPEYKPAKVLESMPKDTAVAAAPAPTDTAAAVAQEEPMESRTAPAEPQEAPETHKGKGLTIDFKEVNIFIPNITARGSGSAYSLKSGSLNGKQINISGAVVQKISQRYQSTVIAKSNLGTLVLDNLGTTSGWQPLRGNGRLFTITGLDAGRLSTARITPATVQNAVSRAARRNRISRSAEQKWLASVHNVRSANQRPLSVKLRSVMWKIDGKTSNGKPFSRQVRMDLPI